MLEGCWELVLGPAPTEVEGLGLNKESESLDLRLTPRTDGCSSLVPVPVLVSPETWLDDASPLSLGSSSLVVACNNFFLQFVILYNY